MMSKIAPRVQRTSLLSAAGGYWKCMPRSVPFLVFEATLACAITDFNPWSRNSFWQKARAKKPRSSVLRSRSIMNAPLSFVSVKIIVRLCLAVDDGELAVRLALGGSAMSQIVGQDAIGDQFLDVADALVAWPLEFLMRQLRLTKRIAELLGSAPRIPLRLEGGQRTCDLAEVDTVGARVGTRIRTELELATRNHLRNDRSDIADAEVVCGLADVERLIGDQDLRCSERRDEGARNIFNMDDRPPRRSIRFQIDETLGHRPSHQIVEYDIETDAWRDAVGGRRAHVGRAETVAAQQGNVALRSDLGFAVRRDRVQRAGFVEHALTG